MACFLFAAICNNLFVFGSVGHKYYLCATLYNFMKKPLLICAAAGLLSFYLSVAKAQTDTTRYDLGRLQIKKSLTQAITIKAADLEKMPFTNLSDAINVWLYGVYGGAAAYVPVIDGIVMTDVNALSIYDIDEITLVQNSAAAPSGVRPQQLLLLIKTRRNRPGKYGIEAAGQTDMVRLHNMPVNPDNYKFKHTVQLYNQYYLSGYVNTSRLHAGLSADYQRDAIPVATLQTVPGSQLYTDGYANINRYKFNGYLDVDLGKLLAISFNTGYVPQSGDSSAVTNQGYSEINTLSKLKENLYYSNISLKSSLAGFRNTLTGGYEYYKSTVNQNDIVAGVSSQPLMLANESKHTTSNYLIKDNLSYTFKTGGLEIEPSVNFMYKYYADTTFQKKTESLVNPGVYSPIQILINTTTASLKSTLLTPALNINYRKVFALQGGFESILSSLGDNLIGNKPKRIYPFASAMLNLTELAGKGTRSTGISIFGSYANAIPYTIDIYNLLSDISTINSLSIPPAINSAAVGNPNSYKAFNQWQAGTTISLFNNKLTFNYTYNARQYNVLGTGYIHGSNYNYYYIFSSKITSHRFGFDINWVKSSKLSWQTNLNASYIKTQFNYPTNIPGLYGVSNITLKGHIITGGLVNRVTFKKLFVGADVLYLFHENAPYTGSNSSPYYNAFNLQNIYAGFKFNLPGTKNLEVFANARSIAEDRSPTLLDTRKYYGLGFKLGI